jgi:hypothetical protein
LIWSALSLISFSSHFQSTITVLSFVEITLSALPSISIVASSSFIQSSSVINVAHVTVAISRNISFFLSPNQGALTVSTFNIPLILFNTSDAKASPSTSSAMITKSFLPVDATASNTCSISFIDEIFLSVTKMYGFSITASILCISVTKYGLEYHWSNCIPVLISFVRPNDFHSSTVIVQSLPISSNTSAIRFPTSSSCADIVATCLIFSLLSPIFLAFFSISSTNLSTALCSPLPSENGFTHDLIYLNPSFDIASARTTVVVVPSQASLLVFSAASLIILAQIFSVFSSKSISLATVTQSFVTIGHQKPLSRITFLHLGHIVTFTASATISIQEKISFLASSQYLISFAILFICIEIKIIFL